MPRSTPSTFSFSALQGNLNRVFFPYNARKLLIPGPAAPLAAVTPTPSWRWVETDYLPGSRALGLPRAVVAEYLNGPRCEAHQRCVPVAPDTTGFFAGGSPT